jgi:hypothetical protein
MRKKESGHRPTKKFNITASNNAFENTPNHINNWYKNHGTDYICIGWKRICYTRIGPLMLKKLKSLEVMLASSPNRV